MGTVKVQEAKAAAQECVDAGKACEKAAQAACAGPRGGGGDLNQLAKRCAEKREMASQAHAEARAFRDEALKFAEAQSQTALTICVAARKACLAAKDGATSAVRRLKLNEVAAEAEALRRKEEEAQREHAARLTAAKDAAAQEELRKAELIR